MPEQVPPEVMAERSRRLRQLSSDKWLSFTRRSIGAGASAVVYRRRDRRTGDLVALTDNYIKVHAVGADALLGRRVEVEIEDVSADGRARGRICDG